MEYEIMIIFLMILFMAVSAGSIFVFYWLLTSLSKFFTALGNSFQVARLPSVISKPLKEARYYAQLITQSTQECPSGPVRDRLNHTVSLAHESLESLQRLEQDMIKLYSHHDLNRDQTRTNFEIEHLKRQLLTVTGREATLILELIKSRKEHLNALEELKSFQAEAVLKIRIIASDLATAHAEMLLIIAKGDFNNNRLRRLDENLQEHLGSLRDMVAVMDELSVTHRSLAGQASH